MYSILEKILKEIHVISNIICITISSLDLVSLISKTMILICICFVIIIDNFVYTEAIFNRYYIKENKS